MAENIVINLQKVDVFQQKHLVLSNVNLDIAKGEFVFLIGQTGSGKSSLLKIIYGDLHIGNGNGAVAGFNLKNLSDNDVPYLRRKLGIVFQDFQLLSDRTIEQNLEFVLKATGWNDQNLINERIKDVLEKVGLRSKIKKMPHEISGGEQQRVVIARALLNNPEIILADEPTGNLDPDTSEEIVVLLKQIGKTFEFNHKKHAYKNMFNKKKKEEEPIIDHNKAEQEIVTEQTETVENTVEEPVIELSIEEKLKSENASLNDKYLRLFAEFDNYKRRTQKERIELLQTASKDVVVSLLPILDDFERAIKATENTTEVEAIREGILLIQTKLNSILGNKGLKSIESLHTVFDTDLHEAITNIPAPTVELKGKVVDELEKGYTLNDKVIRFAKVVVGA